MLLIHKGQENIIAVTLFEKTTIDPENVHYLFKFFNPQTQTSQYFIPTEESNFISRYNKFTILETSTPDPLLGQVNTELTGQWYYFVYEQESATNLDPEGLTLVESGIVVVKEPVTPDVIYNSQPKEYVVYAPES